MRVISVIMYPLLEAICLIMESSFLEAFCLRL